ncbi:MAG TPA: RtcB family protein [Planctomycetota bacterium]
MTRFLAEPPPSDVRAALERLARAGDVRRVAVMPDVHLARDVCVGVAVATTRRIYPAAVGDDIGCGMAALHLGCEAERLDDDSAQAMLADLRRAVPTLRQPGSGGHALPEALAERSLSLPALESEKRRTAARQLGTLGRGNHFVEFQADDEGALWLMLHSGSRSMGQAVRHKHEPRATGREAGLAWFDAEDEAGRAYLADMVWALEFAEVNRRRILERVSALAEQRLGARPDEATLLTCNHNHVRRERIGDEDLWVHRKGAIPARAGEPGIIPGSMGAASYHVEGRGHEEALHSSSHGAGRAMSRSEARQRISLRTLERELRGVWYDQRLAPRLRDEAPGAYKEIGAVMRAQRELTRIVRRLRPLLSYKGA